MASVASGLHDGHDLDEPLVEEAADPVADRGLGDVEGPGDLGVRGAGVLLQQPDDPAVHLVEHAILRSTGRHRTDRVPWPGRALRPLRARGRRGCAPTTGPSGRAFSGVIMRPIGVATHSPSRTSPPTSWRTTSSPTVAPMPGQSRSQVPWCRPCLIASTALGVPLRDTIFTAEAVDGAQRVERARAWSRRCRARAPRAGRSRRGG